MIDPTSLERPDEKAVSTPANDTPSGGAFSASAESASEAPASGGTGSYNGRPDDLHDLFEVRASSFGAEEEDPLAALRNDPNYSALIRDLEYIAKQARLLFEPAQEAPSDEVWDKIQKELSSRPPDA